jgi:hypothetical protein
MKDYNGFNNRHNPDADPVSGQPVTAVLASIFRESAGLV